MFATFSSRSVCRGAAVVSLGASPVVVVRPHRSSRCQSTANVASATGISEARVSKIVDAVRKYIPSVRDLPLKVVTAGAGQVAVSASMFKVTAGDVKYGVKLLDESAVGVDLSPFRDEKEANLLLSREGLTPKIFGWDDAAVVREYVGNVINLGELHGDEDFVKFAKATAKLHNLSFPDSWSAPPFTTKAGIAAFYQHAIAQCQEKSVKTAFQKVVPLIDELPEADGILGRLVLTHGDAKPANLLRVGEEFVFIDLDTLAVRPAFYDVTYSFFMWGGSAGKMAIDPWAKGAWLKDLKIRKTYARTYLEGCGFAADPESVEDFLFQVECFAPQMMFYFAFVCHWLSVNPAIPDAIRKATCNTRDLYLKELPVILARIKQAHSNAKLREDIAMSGIFSHYD